MRRAWKFAFGVMAGVAGVGYARAVVARNRALDRPPIHDPQGQPYGIGLFEFSDGETVEILDTGEGEALV